MEGILASRLVELIEMAPLLLLSGIGKVYLCDDEEVLVTRYHINCVVGKFVHDGTIDTDNRTGFDGLLHSVGVMRDKVPWSLRLLFSGA